MYPRNPSKGNKKAMNASRAKSKSFRSRLKQAQTRSLKARSNVKISKGHQRNDKSL